MDEYEQRAREWLDIYKKAETQEEKEDLLLYLSGEDLMVLENIIKYALKHLEKN